jgi:uncharacterized protein involved in exopolysaccharide biosynthesis
MQTQVDLLLSQRAARKVVEDLKLHENPARCEAFRQSGARGEIEDWIASGLTQGLKVESTQSSVINVTYIANDAKFAATMANAFAKAYMDLTLTLRTEPTKQAATWFDEQLKGLRTSLEESQRQLAASSARRASSPPTSASTSRTRASPSSRRSRCRRPTPPTTPRAALGQTRSNTNKEACPRSSPTRSCRR